MVMMFAGALYRFDVFLVAFNPGAHWSYFPSVPEMLVTVGLVVGRNRRLRLHCPELPDPLRRPHGRARKAGCVMSTHITVDPITRIEGHLRIDVEVDGGVVKKAWSSGQMFRGIERILEGRDPARGLAVHAAVLRRLHDRPRDRVGPRGRERAEARDSEERAVHPQSDHRGARDARPHRPLLPAVRARLGGRRLGAEGRSGEDGGARRQHLRLARQQPQQFEAVKDRLASFVAGGQLGIFTNGYWGHPAMKLSPEVNLLAVSHYLQALDYQRKVNQVVAILGGKTPNIQNLAVGGVANAINLDNQATLNMAEALRGEGACSTRSQQFIEQVYFVGRLRDRRDVCRLAELRRGRHELPVGAGSAARREGHAVRLPGRHDLQRRSRRA